MKNLLKKLNIAANHGDDKEGSRSSRGSKLDVGSIPDRVQQHLEQNKSISAIVGWFNSVTNRSNNASPSSSPSRSKGQETAEHSEAGNSEGFDAQPVVINPGNLESGNSKDHELQDEHQMKLAMEMSVREDPEAFQIEAVKQISLGSCPSGNASAEVVAYRYWNYNSLSYDDKILDGFYDLYGIVNGSSSSMPRLVDLQGAPVSAVMSWEAILVNRRADSNLQRLEQMTMDLAIKERSKPLTSASGELVQEIANLVSDYMGGAVGDPDSILRAWRSLSYSLRTTLGSMVLPLGSLTIGLARHRALLFKVLADSISLPCRLVKGQYTGSDDVAMVFVRIDDGREFIVDLMADPGTLIPSDVAGINVDFDGAFSSPSPISADTEYSAVTTSNSGRTSSFEVPSESRMSTYNTMSRKEPTACDNPHDGSDLTASSSLVGLESDRGSGDDKKPRKVRNSRDDVIRCRPNHPFLHARSPSWTEGVSSPAVRKMKVKDVSQYMIDAAKENPQLAQKLHDVLLESGVVAPPNLFTEIYSDHSETLISSSKPQVEVEGENRNTPESRGQENPGHVHFLPPLPDRAGQTVTAQSKQPVNFDPSVPEPTPPVQVDTTTPAEDARSSSQELGEVSHHVSLDPEASPQKFEKSVSVAAAVAAAAVVASSMIVAVSRTGTDANKDFPIAAAASATAAAVVATTAAVGKQYEVLESSPHSPSPAATRFKQAEGIHSDGDGDTAEHAHPEGDSKAHDASTVKSEAERVSDRSVGAESSKSDAMLDDIGDIEIPWEEITLGERIGLGSHGEVYHGDWNGTEVAVKRLLDQDISGEFLEAFISEVSIMKRLRHPNVVLFMGAVTRPPNLSIVTEFLPRGSLYRLIHRSNNNLDERRRLKMALDAARGMNYLHTCSPVIVHRDLKSPNLLVDRNWVVKVCDFGLSRMKQSTFLSSRSTAGTAEWMAPEVLRNEPSNEKCDVYSYGVILWELFTLQQPWGRMNAMQVVGAVGFQHRRLDIPDNVEPVIADLIRRCWQTDPRLRPSFFEIMAALKPLQKAPSAQAAARSTS
ncbi:putative serine/threonine-protein kinase SIS8 [Drosera capensis]